MKKLLIILLLSLTTIFTQVNAQTNYSLTFLEDTYTDILSEGIDDQVPSSNYHSTNFIQVQNNSLIIDQSSKDYITYIVWLDSNNDYIGWTGESGYQGGNSSIISAKLANDLEHIPTNGDKFSIVARATPSTSWDPNNISFTDFQTIIVSYSSPFSYPAQINLDSNYGDYFDVDIQFQDQDELYQDYPISAQSADVNDDWIATAPTSGIGSFTFQDWYDLDNNVVFSTNPSLSITGPDRDYNLRARYTGVTEYDIDLNMESGVSGSIQYQGNSFSNNSIGQIASVIDQTVPDGTEWQATAPNVAGQNFDHWYDLNSNSIYSTNQFIQIALTTQDFNLEARYSAVPTYTFTFDTNLPNPDEFEYRPPSSNIDLAAIPPVTQTVNEGESFIVKAQTENLGLYTFDGWYDLDNNQFYSTNSDITVSNIQRNWNLEARYSLPDQYDIDLILSSQIGNIQFQIDDNTPIFAPSISETVFAGQDFQATAPDDPSYEFQHWFDLNNDVIFSENLFITAQDVDRDYNLEARYLEIFDITFDTAGGDPINADTAVDGEQYALPTPTREGFIFLGWNDSNDVLPRPIIESPYTITQDVTFIANWVQVITVNFNSNGGTAVDSQNVSAGGVITQPVTPAKFGYLFDGWYTDNNTFANEYDFNNTVNTAFTLHAKWILGSDSDVGETLNGWIEDSGISAIFIVLVIMIAISVTLGLIKAQMFVIIISNLSIIFVFTALGFIPLWIVLVSGLALIGFIIMTTFGGSKNA